MGVKKKGEWDGEKNGGQIMGRDGKREQVREGVLCSQFELPL